MKNHIAEEKNNSIEKSRSIHKVLIDKRSGWVRKGRRTINDIIEPSI